MNMSFKKLPDKLSMPAALDGYNLSKYLIFFQETSLKVENSNFLTLWVIVILGCNFRFSENFR